jgi:hypothetical protein
MPVQEACRVCGNPLGFGCGFGVCGRQDVVHDGTNGRFVCVRKDGSSFRAPSCDLAASTVIWDGKEFCRREDGKFYENVAQRGGAAVSRDQVGQFSAERHFVCPVCKKGFHLSTPGVYQDGVGGFFCSKACIERHPVLDDDGGLRASLLALESVKPLSSATIPPNETMMVRNGVVMLPHEANEDRQIRDDAGRYSSQGDVVVGNGTTGERDWKAESEMNRRRANRLADECQALKDQNTELLAENARLRRSKR